MRLSTWKTKDFIRVLKANGYDFLRSNGDHLIYSNGLNKITITSPKIKGLIVKRLIKENNLIIN